MTFVTDSLVVNSLWWTTEISWSTYLNERQAQLQPQNPPPKNLQIIDIFFWMFHRPSKTCPLNELILLEFNVQLTSPNPKPNPHGTSKLNFKAGQTPTQIIAPFSKIALFLPFVSCDRARVAPNTRRRKRLHSFHRHLRPFIDYLGGRRCS